MKYSYNNKSEMKELSNQLNKDVREFSLEKYIINLNKIYEKL
jgi:hypothetical protein